MKLIQFPKKKSKSQTKVGPIKKKPIKGELAFHWIDVESVECSEKGKGIIHFKSGREYNSTNAFEEIRDKFIASRKRRF